MVGVGNFEGLGAAGVRVRGTERKDRTDSGGLLRLVITKATVYCLFAIYSFP